MVCATVCALEIGDKDKVAGRGGDGQRIGGRKVALICGVGAGGPINQNHVAHARLAVVNFLVDRPGVFGSDAATAWGADLQKMSCTVISIEPGAATAGIP